MQAPIKRLNTHSPRFIDLLDVPLAGSQGNQSRITGVGDGDNLLSMRWGKSGARSSMNHAADFGTGWHWSATGLIRSVDED